MQFCNFVSENWWADCLWQGKRWFAWRDYFHIFIFFIRPLPEISMQMQAKGGRDMRPEKYYRKDRMVKMEMETRGQRGWNLEKSCEGSREDERALRKSLKSQWPMQSISVSAIEERLNINLKLSSKQEHIFRQWEEWERPMKNNGFSQSLTWQWRSFIFY